MAPSSRSSKPCWRTSRRRSAQAVLVEYPRHGIWCIGFLTGVTRGEVQKLTDEEVLNVFLR